MSSTDLPGRVLGLDYGSKRVGVAVSDPLRIAAYALEVIARDQAVFRVMELVDEHQVVEVVIGLPTSLSGREGQAAVLARQFAAEVAEATGLSVSMFDERFSTATADRAMLEAGTKRRVRRENVDMVAATVILQGFLDR